MWVFTVDCCVNLMRSPGWDAAVVQQQQRGWARLESPLPAPPPQPSSIPTKPRSPATAATRPTHGQPSSPHFLRPAVSCAKLSRIFRGTQHLQNALLPNNALSLLKLSSIPNNQIEDPLNFKDLLN